MGLKLGGLADDHRDDQRNETEWHYPLGRYVDHFTAGSSPVWS